MDKVSIFEIEIKNISLKVLVHELAERLIEKSPCTIYTPNTEIVMAAKKNSELRYIINSGTYVIPDGIGLIYGSKIKGIQLHERVTGFDTSMELLRLADENRYSLYLLGGKPGVAEEAAKKLSISHPGIRISGFHHGYFEGSHTGASITEEEQGIIVEIANAKPDILFVGFGFPRQERWIYTHGNTLSSTVIIGNGGVIDILAGQAKRAPDIFIKLGLEWFYRLITNPSRIKRQIVLPLFLIQILFSKNAVNKIS